MRSSRSSGFTLVELIITLAILGILVIIGLPALMNMLDRQALVSSTKQAAQMFRLARYTAVKQATTVSVIEVFSKRQVIAFVDTNANCTQDAGEDTIGSVTLPKGVDQWGPTDAAAGGANATTGFANSSGCAQFQSAGSVADTGAYRFRGRQGDFLEVRVDPAATGRVFLRKWFGGADPTTNWWMNGEQGHNWWS